MDTFSRTGEARDDVAEEVILQDRSNGKKIVNELSILVSAEQGKGVNTAGDIIGAAASTMGLYVFQNIEYHSNIMGKNSYYRIILSESPVHSHHDLNDLAILLGGDAMTHVLDKVRPGGAVLYNTENTKRHFEPEELVREAIDKINSKDILAFGIPATRLIKNLSNASAIKPAILAKMTNTLILGATYAVLGTDIDYVNHVIEIAFKKKPKMIPLNQEAADIGFNYIVDNFDFHFNMRLADISDRVEENDHRLLLKGTTAVSLGAINAGMQFYCYYPITPASDTGDLLDEWKTKTKIMVEQAEDEIGAINAAIGAGRTGVRSMTGTSGPGFDLKSEALGMAIMTEDPVVIMLAQRPGPSTGLPTRGDQSDLVLSMFAGHGGGERIILMAGDVTDVFYMIQNAFNLADKFQMPVIFMTDKSIMNSMETVPPFDLDRIPIDRGEILTQVYFDRNGKANGEYERYKLTENGISPRSLPGIAGGEYNSSTDEHTEKGIITDDPDNRIKFMEKRFRKMQEVAKVVPEEDRVAFFGDKNADISLIAWGSTKGPILDGMKMLQEEGYKVNFLQIKYASPFPAKYVKDFLTKAKLSILIEENRLSIQMEDGSFSQRGQMEVVIRAMTGLTVDKRILKLNTRSFSMEEIHDYVKQLESDSSVDTIYGDRI